MSSSTGGRTSPRSFNFGRTYVVNPKGKHQATVAWLHGLGDNGSGWSRILETLPLPNIKWICPTAPTQPLSMFGGFPATAWCEVRDFSEDAPVDFEGLDASTAHVVSLLSNEPSDVKIGLGGFSMGAATALYSAVCFSHGEFSNGSPYPANISAVVGLSGWLPDAKNVADKLQGKAEALGRAAALPILLCHGTGDEVVPYKYGEKSWRILSSAGFQDTTFKSYDGFGHFTSPIELDLVCSWLSTKLGLDGSS